MKNCDFLHLIYCISSYGPISHSNTKLVHIKIGVLIHIVVEAKPIKQRAKWFLGQMSIYAFFYRLMKFRVYISISIKDEIPFSQH